MLKQKVPVLTLELVCTKYDKNNTKQTKNQTNKNLKKQQQQQIYIYISPWIWILHWEENDVALNLCWLKIQMASWATWNSGMLLDIILKYGLFI